MTHLGQVVAMRRYVAASEDGTHQAMQRAHGEEYAQALVDGDPEVDLEQVGRRIGRTDTVYLDHDGRVMFAPPAVVEVLMGPDGDD